MFCKHDYEIIAKTYAPALSIESLERGGGRGLLYMLMGVTTVLLKCKKCQKIREEEMLGKEQK